jgi:neutral ceramidase
MNRTLSILTGLVLLAFSVQSPAAEAPRGFRAGAATSNITPRLGISINGNMQDKPAAHIHDDLHARCLALDDGATRLVFVVCDSCMIPREVFDQAKAVIEKATGVPASHMMMSATHTHSAPASASVFQSDADMEYRAFLAARIVDGVRRALNNLAPAKVGWGAASEPNQVFNRRWRMKEGTKLPNPFGGEDKVKMNPGVGNPNLLEPAGPTDPEVSVLAVQTPDGQPIALLANYSLHYVGGVGGAHISADYFGAFADRIQELLKADRHDPPFVGIMSNGTSGDINNVNFRGSQQKQPPYGQIRRVADDVAEAALAAYRQISFRDAATLRAAQKEITLGVRKPTPDEVTRARGIMSRSKVLPRMETQEEIYARETVQIADYPDTVKVILQAFRIGDLAVCSSPCETFVEIGLRIKRESPFKPTFTIELANGYNGYLPTPEQHQLGGYETWRAKSSYLEVGAAPRITATLFELLAALK